jgi:hypothetical protein
MDDVELLMPVSCPECGREGLCALVVSTVADALISGRPIHLRSSCHARGWEADLAEREQLREYLAAACIRCTPAATGDDLERRQARRAPLRICSYSVVMHIDEHAEDRLRGRQRAQAPDAGEPLPVN